MIIDCFTFNNELDMLESRLQYLNSYIDYFVIVEANKTHSGLDKKLVFESNKSRFDKYLNKIIYLPQLIDEEPKDSWVLEANQRDFIIHELQKFSEDDVAIVSDVDEIPNPKLFESVLRFLGEGDSRVARLEQSMFMYNLRNKQMIPWHRPYIAKVKTILQQTPSWLRSRDEKHIYHNFTTRPNGNYPEIHSQLFIDGGWHLSYFMNANQIVNKIESFGHTEYNSAKIKDLARIQKCIDDEIDVFDRSIVHEKINVEQEFTQEFLSCFNRLGT